MLATGQVNQLGEENLNQWKENQSIYPLG